MKLSVVINTKNAENTLDKCLRSVSFADEIVVVDMESSDNTLTIAKKHGAKIFHHEDRGYADPARDFALSQAKGDWILVVDADEEISPTLRKKILSTISSGNQETTVYLLPRKNIIFKKWIQKAGWWPDYQVRLFQKGMVSWKVGVHRHPDTKGKVEKFSAHSEFAILHHNYQFIHQFIQRLNRYTSLQATERSKPDSSQSVSEKIWQSFTSEFISRFFSQKGIDEGVHGLSLSLLQSFYELTISLKQWEKDDFPITKNDQESSIHSLRVWQKSLNYWIADWKVAHTSGIRKLYWKFRRKYEL